MNEKKHKSHSSKIHADNENNDLIMGKKQIIKELIMEIIRLVVG